MSRTVKILALVALVALATGTASAAVLRVPTGLYPTITSALKAARTGDVILVAKGTYRENITWPSTDGIRLIGEEGYQKTIIDGGQKGRVINFGSGLTRATVVQGFTLTGGFMNTSRNHGNGLYVSSSPTIRGNLITGNVGDGTSWNYGGGLYVARGSSALIEHNIIRKNILRNGSWNYGAGIYVDGGATPDIYCNQILENENQAGSRGYGGGIFVSGTPAPNIVGNVIAGNLCKAGSWNYGGGIRVYNSAEANIINNTIAHNVCSPGNWRYGGGIDYAGTKGTILNNIVVGNTASTGGGINAPGGMNLDFNNVWNNTASNFAGGAKAGLNGISLDPVFIGTGNYHIAYNSQCVDAGLNSAPPTAAVMDYDKSPRRLDGDLDGLQGDGAHIDIGADEYSISGLTVSGPPVIGTTVNFNITGPTGAAWSLLYSPATGNFFVNPYGIVLIGIPFGLMSAGVTPGVLPVPLPNVTALLGVTLHVQGIVAFTAGGQSVGHITPRLDLTFF